MIHSMRETRTRFALALLLSSAFGACSVFSPDINPGEVIFQDDFERPESGWDRYSDDLYTADYVEGTYVIRVDGENMTAWSLPHLDLENVLIRVEAYRRAGPVDNVYGVICRYQDPEDFYFFLIASDGYAGIGRYVAGQKELLNHETLLPNDAVGPIEETNLIQAACIDEQLTLWVNGEVVAEASAPEQVKGDVGLIVGSYEVGGVEIQFDNFSTLMP